MLYPCVSSEISPLLQGDCLKKDEDEKVVRQRVIWIAHLQSVEMASIILGLITSGKHGGTQFGLKEGNSGSLVFS